MSLKLTIPIRGMHCRSCELMIEKNLGNVKGVKYVHARFKEGLAVIHYSDHKPSHEALAAAIQKAGYEIGLKEKTPWISKNWKDYRDLVFSAIILLCLYVIASWLGLFNLNAGSEENGIWISLVVGLVAGVSTCMAIVGGLVLAIAARHAELHPEATPMQRFRPHIYFNIGRVIGFGILGGLIGYLGSAFTPSTQMLGILTAFVGFVMVFLGLKLIEIFPALRDKTISLPSSIGRFFGFHKENKEYSHKGSIISGALTFFLPCGFTQAMQLYAISTGSFIDGAIIMSLFALGTAPGLLGIGGLSSIFKGKSARIFFMIAGLAVIILGAINLMNANTLLKGTITNIQPQVQTQEIDPNIKYQEVKMLQDYDGYFPYDLVVKKDQPVKWIITSTGGFSCASSLVMPEYGISKNLKEGENIIIFTPTKTGEIIFSCSMGMYAGRFIVEE